MAYLPLSTANLPDPVIDPAQGASPEDYFNTVLWTGNATTDRQITVGFQPDWVWGKKRSEAGSHRIYNVIRGVNNELRSDSTGSEVDQTGTDTFTSFDSDGFTIGANNNLNKASQTFVAWNWKAGGEPTTDNVAGVGNVPTAGSVKIDGVDSTSALAGSVAAKRISANTEAGFSIIQWDATTYATIATGLNQQAEMVIVREFASTTDWPVYHKDATTADDQTLYLNTTNAIITVAVPMWDVSEFSSSVIGIGGNGRVNSNAIAFCFHSVEGFSKCSSYVGNGSADGTFVYTGFRPAFVMVKSSSAGEHWNIPVFTTDTNGSMNTLSPNLSNAERTMDQNPAVDFVSNGFKIRTSDANYNSNGGSYIYMAFAEDGGPFKYSRAR